MKMSLSIKNSLLVASALTLTLGATARAQATAAVKERCATRLSVAVLGRSPAAALVSSADPQSTVEQMLTTADFQERFSRFINATFNNDPGATPEEDSAYYLTKYVLTNNRPWKDMFVGGYKVERAAGANANAEPTVTVDANGLGYFRSRPWLVRYAGNEEKGIKLNSAYRIMNNTIGLKLVAATQVPGLDLTATGRQAAQCKGCHFDPWFALDKVASVLTVRNGTDAATMTFTPPTGGPQQLLGGITISDDKGLVEALVNSKAFEFRACRIAFEFLYGRPEYSCEGPVFDKCMT
ncbi:MAG: hypothetical protein ACT4TC_04490, partial [Myxococcaceae bacterium]